jgi:hypothetical protein
VRPLVRRLLSPAGFLLVAMCFLLPFVTVSCEMGTVDATATYTGTDLVGGGVPDRTIPVEPELGRTDSGSVTLPELTGGDEQPIAVQPLAVIAMGLLVLGIAAAALPQAGPRAALAAGLAAVAALVLIVGQLVAKQWLTTKLAAALHDSGVAGKPSDMIHTRYGFWVTLALLAAVAAGNTVALVRGARMTGRGEPPAEAVADAGDHQWRRVTEGPVAGGPGPGNGAASGAGL